MTVTTDPTTSRPTFLLVKGVDRHHGHSAVSSERATAIAEDFLAANGSAFGISSLDELVVDTVKRDELGFAHVRFRQVYQGLPVVSVQMYVHLNAKGEVYAVSGVFAPNVTIGTTPGITAEAAGNIARAEAQAVFQTINSPVVAETKLVVLPLGIMDNKREDEVYLAWRVLVDEEVSKQSYTYFIDARSGGVLKAVDNVSHLVEWIYDCCLNSQHGDWTCPSQRYDSTYNCWFGRRHNAPPRGPCPVPGMFFGSMAVDTCYNILTPLYNYYLTTFGRNGANNYGGIGNGMFEPLGRTAVFVNGDNVMPAADCPAGSMWLGDWGEMTFCLGAEQFADNVGHEYGHAVVYSELGGNNSAGESGSLDESFADVMGEAFENYRYGQHDWIQCLECVPSQPRIMSDPPSGYETEYGPHPDRKYFWNYYCGAWDQGGIHFNSTVPSKAAYLMSEGGQFNGCYIQGIGFAAMQQVLYRAWCNYMTLGANFGQAITALQQACIDLYPDSLASVTAALQAVEMDQPGRCDTTRERAPFCAIHAAGTVSTDSVAYGVITIDGEGGLPGKIVTVDLVSHPASDSIWAAIPFLQQATGIIEADSRLHLPLAVDTVGVFDVVVDENSDGFYQPWADTILTVEVRTGAVQRLVAQYVEPNRILLSWQPLAGATHYAVESDSSVAFSFPAVIATVTDTVFTDSVSTATHLRMFYRVRAVNP